MCRSVQRSQKIPEYGSGSGRTTALSFVARLSSVKTSTKIRPQLIELIMRLADRQTNEQTDTKT